jgi:gliding motility associated protien GldN
MNTKTIAWSLISLSLAGQVVLAQEKVEPKGSLYATNHTDEGDMLVKNTLWRRVDLNEKQNQAMFSKNNEISKYLIEAAKAGLIDAYTSDSCTVKLSPETLRKKLLIPNQAAGLSAEEIAAGFGEPTNNPTAAKADDGWGAPVAKKQEPVEEEDDGWGPPKKKTTAKKEVAPEPKPVEPEPAKDSFEQDFGNVAVSEDEYFPSQLYLLELKEDWGFDRKRSRLTNQIQAMTLLLPSEQNPNGLEIPIASFKYEDVEKLFRSDPKKYIWYNSKNIAQNKNLADAFDLRLFWGRIVKYSNAHDKSFLDMYQGEKEALTKSLNYEQQLMEIESGFWEY